MKHYCIIGHPVDHALSPHMHNAAFKALKIDADFAKEHVLPEDLENFMHDFRAKYSGASVTIPHKETVMKFLDEIDDTARKIGAVNTILNKNGWLIGYNTDCYGAIEALGGIAGKRVCILGAGGAARAILYGCLQAGAQVVILNRTVEKAQKLAQEFSRFLSPNIQSKSFVDIIMPIGSETLDQPKISFGSLKDFDSAQFDVVINTTSCGMHPQENESPLVIPSLSRDLVVMDVIYSPLKTKLIKEAEKAGCKIITGDKMLLNQAVKAFEIWTGPSTELRTGKKAPKEVMESTLLLFI